MNDERFMKLALEEAALSLEEGELPVGCIAVYNDEVIAKAHKNKKLNSWLDHAETLAIRQALEKINSLDKKEHRKISIYTTLEPCAMCFGTIAHAQIGRLVFALEDPYGGATATKFEAPRHKTKSPEIKSGIMRNEAVELFRKFFETTQVQFWKNTENELVKLCL